MSTSSEQAARRVKPLWPGLLVWLAAWSLMVALDHQVDLANQALLLILAAALAAIWWSPTLSAATIGLSVLAFNFAFVPPRGTLAVDLYQHGLLLVAMVSVSWIVTALMARLRRVAAAAEESALRSDELRRWGDALRESESPLELQGQLRDMLTRLGGGETSLWVKDEERSWGPLSSDERDGLQLCVRSGQALGPGSGRHEDQPAWYLPLRGRQRTHGASLVRLGDGDAPAESVRDHAQALCDQLGTALERTAAEMTAARAHEQAQLQSMRNTLLSAVAHDHRTPLATIISAAGALHDQADRLDAQRRQRLASTILDEASQLARITDNTLQLARLDAVGLDLSRDWESPEELIGSVMRRLRQRDPTHRLRARVPTGLPLVRCDAVLIVQLVDNLLDNALKHAGGEGPVEVTAQVRDGNLVIAVKDRGPGVPAELLPRLFEPFSRGVRSGSGVLNATSSARGTGVGLALCRAIARVHGGELTVRQRRGGGACFEVTLPIEPLPAAPHVRLHQESSP